MLYDWDIHSSDIVRRLRRRAFLKICTKNCDEPELIESWILHHAAIVGLENLIIADNGTSHPDTIRIYAKYSSAATIFRFSGNFDEIHAHPRFSLLFEVIRESARFYAVFDTDERLVLIEDDHWKAGVEVLRRLSVADVEKPVPTTWLINRMNSLAQFTFRTTEGTEEFLSNMIWGKPILPAKLVGLQHGIHNIEFRNFAFSRTRGLKLFLLHLTQLPDRRLRVNKSKLVNSGLVNPHCSFEEIAALDASTLSNTNALRFISEIRLMLAAKRSTIDLESGNERFIELDLGGSVLFSSDSAQKTMQQFLDDWELNVEDLFGLR